MNYDSYMTMDATLKTMGNINPDSGLRKADTERVIKCYIYGAHKLYRSATGELTASEQTVLTKEVVNVGDYINGHEVKSVETFSEFDGQIAYYGALL